jgi:hypothetical protein
MLQDAKSVLQQTFDSEESADLIVHSAIPMSSVHMLPP